MAFKKQRSERLWLLTVTSLTMSIKSKLKRQFTIGWRTKYLICYRKYQGL